MNSFNTELSRCNLCGSRASSLLFPDIVLSESGAMGIVRCSQCGLVYRNIRKTNDAILNGYVSKEYLSPAPGWIEGRKKVFRPYVEMLSKFRKTSHILDVGAGHGFFLAACKDAGWTCQGIEPSLQCRTFAEREFGFRLSGDTLESTRLQSGSFDIITFWNVLEHLPDPKETLTHACRLLRPGGAVVIRSSNAVFHVSTKKTLANLGKLIPLLRSVDQTVFHLHSFDRRTIVRMLHDVGFNDVKASPARLSWTTTHDAEAKHLNGLITRAVDITARIVYRLTASRWLLSPSLVTIGTKSEDTPS